MSGEGTSYRWWENYLVRYLMPSIAGVGILCWLFEIASPDFRNLLFLHAIPTQLNPATLTLLILYGNLFCYVASYPILGFHVTRVLDFEYAGWKRNWLDGYSWTVAVAGLTLSLATILQGDARIIGVFALTTLFSFVQCRRVFKASTREIPVSGLKTDEPSSKLFGFIYSLSIRRGDIQKVETETTKSGNESVETTHTYRKKKEVMDTYRHMREHGNSAFIFVLEMILAGIFYCVLSVERDAPKALSMLGIILAIWAFPSMLIHATGQAVERRFSHFDRRLKEAIKEKALEENKLTKSKVNAKARAK